MTTINYESVLDMLISILDEKRILYRKAALPFQTMQDIPDHGLRAVLYGADTPCGSLFPDVFEEDGQVIAYQITDTFRCSYILFPLTDSDDYGMFGPYVNGQITHEDMKNVKQYNGLSKEELAFYQQFISALPKLYDSDLLEGTLNVFFQAIYGEKRFLLRNWKSSRVLPSAHAAKPASASFQKIEQRYADEQLLMKGITEGNAESVKSVLSHLSSYGFESRTESPIRDMKNYSIVFNTICRISALNGGAHPAEIDAISREYSYQIENARDYGDLLRIQDAMVHSYCSSVSAHGSRKNSIQVERTIAYISANFQKPLTLSAAADELGITKTYLSAVFKKETGTTFSSYVTEYRMKAAAGLLRTTRLSISEIASTCGIFDTNYFSRLFRRTYGMAPKEYRVQMRNARKQDL